ncbi:MAG: Cytochrome c-type biogenesis protein CcmF [Holosporales bacterium]
MLKTYACSILGHVLFLWVLCHYTLCLFMQNGQKRFLTFASSGLIASYLLLTYCSITNDFSLAIVGQQSSRQTPLLYKIVGVWGSSQGSFLLWNTVLSLGGYILREKKTQRLFAFHMVLMLALQCLVLFPFTPSLTRGDGQDLNPLLQDHAMAIHPPVLYLSHVILGWLFFKINETTDVFFYVRTGFALSTLGILLGSMWAYYELGWGGFWFWDSVEVISLFSWLIYLLAFHAMLTRKKIHEIIQNGWLITLLGIGLVRSGCLQSVHSFAQDPEFGLYFSICFLFVVFIKRMLSNKNDAANDHSAKHLYIFALWMCIIGFCFLSVVAPILYPKLCFTPRFYTAFFWPITVCLLAYLVFYNARFKAIYGLLFLLLTLILWDDFNLPLHASGTIALCCIGLLKYPVNFNKDLGHKGFYIFILSCVWVSFKSTETSFIFDDVHQVHTYCGKILNIKQVQSIEADNYIGHQVTLNLGAYTLKPTLKYFQAAEKAHSEMAIKTVGFNQYAAVIESMDANHVCLRTYIKEGILGVWLGVLLMIFAIGRYRCNHSAQKNFEIFIPKQSLI